MSDELQFRCPIPLTRYPRVSIAHGGGGRLMRQLIEQMFVPAFGGAANVQLNDSAVFARPAGRLAFTTDSFVVRPLFFPGGDIGRLAVFGTVNDLAMSGARPMYLSVSFILEEGLPMETLWQVVQSIAQAAREAQVTIVTGDTKVVERGCADGMYITTSGVGFFCSAEVVRFDGQLAVTQERPGLEPGRVKPGDAILVSGDVGRHGIAVLAQREGLEFETEVESDCGPLVAPIQELLGAGIDVHCLRDLTRGGLATALIEVADASGTRMRIDESRIVVSSGVRAACELLGLDPLYVANEGRFAAWVAADQVEEALVILSRHAAAGVQPVCVGYVESAERRESANVESRSAESSGVEVLRKGEVVLRTTLGGHRLLDLMSGEQLPRIC